MKYYFLIIFTLFFSAGHTQSKEIDSYLNQLITDANANSASISIYIEKGVVYDSTIINKSNQIHGTKKNIFRIGSVSKVLTSGIVLELAKNGKLELHEPVNKYLPTKYPDLLTIKSLGSHTSGIRHYLHKEDNHFRKHYSKTSNTLNLFINDSLLFQPMTDHRYTTYGINLLGALLEQVQEKPFSEIANDFFEELGLNETHVENHNNFPANYTDLYNRNEQITNPKDISYKWPGGGFRSTTKDLVKYGSLFFADSKFFPYELLEEIYRPTEISTGEKIDYGFGWQIDSLNNGETIIYHDGEIEGGHCVLLVLPKSKISIAIAINRGGNFSITEGLQVIDIVDPLEIKRVSIAEDLRQKQIRKVFTALDESIDELRSSLVKGSLSKKAELIDNNFHSKTWKTKKMLIDGLGNTTLVEVVDPNGSLHQQVKGIRDGALAYYTGLDYENTLSSPSFIFILRREEWKLFSIE